MKIIGIKQYEPIESRYNQAAMKQATKISAASTHPLFCEYELLPCQGMSCSGAGLKCTTETGEIQKAGLLPGRGRYTGKQSNQAEVSKT